MAGKIWGAVAIFLGLAVLLAGCAGAPRPQAAPVPQAPLPQVRRSPQDVALERALGEFYGAPYHAGGTTPAGVDCSGLVQALLQRAGVNLPRTVAQQYNYGRPVGPENCASVTWSSSTATASRAVTFTWPTSCRPSPPRRFATTASTWAKAASCTPPPRGFSSAAWTPRFGALLIKGPGGICLSRSGGSNLRHPGATRLRPPGFFQTAKTPFAFVP